MDPRQWGSTLRVGPSPHPRAGSSRRPRTSAARARSFPAKGASLWARKGNMQRGRPPKPTHSKARCLIRPLQKWVLEDLQRGQTQTNKGVGPRIEPCGPEASETPSAPSTSPSSSRSASQRPPKGNWSPGLSRPRATSTDELRRPVRRLGPSSPQVHRLSAPVLMPGSRDNETHVQRW